MLKEWAWAYNACFAIFLVGFILFFSKENEDVLNYGW